MKNEKSYGIVPVRQWNGDWQVLLVQHHSGYWAFPKGHPEIGETAHETAVRELFEETGLKVVDFLSQESFAEHYFFRHNSELISKKVEYFVALVAGTLVLQEEEIQAYQWLSFEEAIQCMTFKEGKSLCQKVQEILKCK